jgi:hypothetical protein
MNIKTLISNKYFIAAAVFGLIAFFFALSALGGDLGEESASINESVETHQTHLLLDRTGSEINNADEATLELAAEENKEIIVND